LLQDFFDCIPFAFGASVGNPVPDVADQRYADTHAKQNPVMDFHCILLAWEAVDEAEGGRRCVSSVGNAVPVRELFDAFLEGDIPE
jgi:hypothetical protein